MTRKKDKPDLSKLVSPENLKSVDELMDGKDMGKPIVTFGDKESLLYMVTQELGISGFSINYMASDTLHNKDQTIETRGRIRYNESGTKFVFGSPNPVPFTLDALEVMKKEALQGIKVISELAPAVGVPTELNFAPDTEFEVIIKAMNDTGKFNVAIAEKNGKN